MEWTQNTKEAHHEALFAIGNGYLGTRAHWHETGGGTPGTFINGFYDLRPFVHAEWAYGYPELFEQMVQLPEPMVLSILLDGERFTETAVEDPVETLDMDTGVYRREYTVNLEKPAKIRVEKLISFTHRNVMAMRVFVAYDGDIAISVRTEENGRDKDFLQDPRVTDSRVQLIPHPPSAQAPWQKRSWHTLPSARPVGMALRVACDDGEGLVEGMGELSCTAVCLAYEGEEEQALLAAHETTDFDNYLIEQKEFLTDFWEDAGMTATDEQAKRQLAWTMFQLLQSTGRDGVTNIAAKGLTGEGYGGHTFWDTEMYMLPVYQQCRPETARQLLHYRYRMLPAALSRAKELGHDKGAAYPWRTISGRESSGYVPAGTAQYHLNADIAWSFIRHWQLTGDVEFLFEEAAEVVIQTARIFHTIGNFTDDGFHIHSVTGPDEYTAQISDNYFTNRMAKHTLLWANKIAERITAEDAPRARELLDRLEVTDEELQSMRQAGRDMVLLFDEEKGIRKQDASFLDKPVWDFENTPASMYPLLLHVHPLTIYRHQVLKQADTVLCDVIFSEGPVSVLAKDYEYYEALTTHDSSLSACAHAMAALAVGKWEEGEKQFVSSLVLDLHNTHDNTEHGLHMANLGGTLLTVTRGFAGLRFSEDGFSLSPVRSERLGGYSFRFYWRGERIELSVGEEILLTTDTEDPIPFRLYGQQQTLSGYGTYPLREKEQKAVLFDLDGVLTDTAPLHYAAWRQLAQEKLGFDLPQEFQRKVAGVSRRKSLDLVISHGGMRERFTEEEKEALATLKNDMYRARISDFTKEDLLPGAKEALEAIRRAGGKTALVSASRNAPALIEKLGIADLFDVIAHPDEIKHPKPAPDPFLHAAEQLNVLPVNCLGVEDARAGIESIRAARMWELGIGERAHLDTRYAVPGMKEALPLIMKWLEGEPWQM